MRNSTTRQNHGAIFSHFPVISGGGQIVLYWLLFLLVGSRLEAQGVSFCGEYQAPLPAIGPPNTWIYDRFGNTYDPDDLILERFRASSVCNAGRFELNFVGLPSDPFPTDEMATICAVFEYVSEEIGAPTGANLPKIPINIVRESEAFQALATGSEFFTGQCGVVYSAVLEMLRTNVTALPNNVSSGVVRIRRQPTPDATWYTLQDQLRTNPPGIQSNEFDLYSVVLHEVLHILGIASRIQLDGTPLPNAYSTWDKFLFSDIKNDFLLMAEEDPDCCSRHAFNNGVFDMPADLSGNCEDTRVVFRDGGTPLATVNSSFIVVPTTNNEMANKLSHLDKGCGGAEYVMQATIDRGEIRRVITDAEKRMLCLIGYKQVGSTPTCSEDCTVIANDDYTTTVLLIGSSINVNMLQNDAYPAGNVEVAVCGNFSPLQVTLAQNGSELQVTAPPGTPEGNYSFCYTISACDGESCDQATVYLIVTDGIIQTDCQRADCNLVCFGDFNDFQPGFGVYDNQVGNAAYKIGSSSSSSTADIFLEETGNKVLRFAQSNQPNIEGVLIPLSAPYLPAGCTANITLKAVNAIVGGTLPANTAPILSVHGLAQIPCASINTPVCDPNFLFCSGVQGYCAGIRTLSYDKFTGQSDAPQGVRIVSDLDLVTLPAIEWANNTGQTITHLFIFGTLNGVDPTTLPYQTEFFIDDLAVTTSCQSQVRIKPTVLQECSDGNVVVEYEVCLQGSGNTPVNITLQADPSLSATIVPGGGFDANGEATFSLTPGADCNGGSNTQILTLTMNNIGVGTPGTILKVAMNGTASGACVNTAGNNGSVSVTLQPCAPNPNACDNCPGSGAAQYVIGANPDSETRLKNLPSIPSSINGACIIVNGDLIVDRPAWEVKNTYFRMNNGARIIVESGSKLQFSHNTLEGCDHLWYGIMDRGGSIEATFNTIKDAQYGFHLQRPALALIDDNTFDRCYVGIYGKNLGRSGGGTLAGNLILPFTSDKFYCTSILKSPYTGQDPAEYSSITYAGVWMTQMGAAAVNKCDFLGLRNGVLSISTAIIVEDCTINNLVSVGARSVTLSENLNNFCVWTKDCGLVEVKACSFQNFWYGIYCQNANLKANNNELFGYPDLTGIEALGYGIYVLDCDNRDVEIKNNGAIEIAGDGISLTNSQFMRAYVYQNPIHILRNRRFGIRLDNVKKGTIKQNSVTHNNGFQYDAGISILNSSEIDFVENQLYGGKYGMEINGGEGNYYLGNRASLLSDDPDISKMDYGFKTLMGSGEYCRNITEGFETNKMKLGFEFKNFCYPTYFRCQSIGLASEHGLLLESDALIGPEGNIGNIWIDSTSDARHEGLTDGWVLASQFTYNAGEEPSWSTAAGPKEAVVWFDDSDIPHGCPSICSPERNGEEIDPIQATAPIEVVDTLTAQAAYANTAYNWMAQQHLYARLRQNPALKEGNSIMETFYGAAEGQPTALFHDIEVQREASIRRSAYDRYQFKIVQQKLAQKTEELYTLYLDTTSILETLLSKQAELDALNILWERYNTYWHEKRREEASALFATNQSINPPNLCAANEQTLNALYLENRFWEGGKQTTGILNQVKAIADQCPTSGGFAVFAARAWYRRFVPEADWDDSAACDTMEERPLIQRNVGLSVNLVRLQPNPANNLLYVTPLAPTAEPYYLALFATTGEKVLEKTINGNALLTTLDIGALPSGLYYYTVQSHRAAFQSGKLTITH